VRQALDVIQKELDVTMALTGIRSVKDASPAILRDLPSHRGRPRVV
jgi:isopentenyl diphosphate isomerase/L-lactate dehydrogenase-like FMN-dependent dehydrogenase